MTVAAAYAFLFGNEKRPLVIHKRIKDFVDFVKFSVTKKSVGFG